MGEIMELLWALLIVFGFIYARFCTNYNTDITNYIFSIKNKFCFE